jgi:fatty acid desaturase
LSATQAMASELTRTSIPLDGAKQALSELRSSLLTSESVRRFLETNRLQRGNLCELVMALAFLFLGLGLVVLATRYALPLLVVGAAVEVWALSAISSLTHESWHGNLAEDRSVNNFVATYILSPLLVSEFAAQQRRHLLHHARLGEDVDEDRTLYQLTTEEFVGRTISRLLVIPHLIKLARSTRTQVPSGASPLTPKGVASIVFVQVAWATLLGIPTVLLGGGVWAVLAALVCGQVVPLLIASFMVDLRGHREHAYIGDVRYPLTADTACSSLERMIVAGGYFNWHACHHLFPEIPQRLLPELAALLRNEAGGLLNHYDRPSSPVVARRSYLSSTPEFAAPPIENRIVIGE